MHTAEQYIADVLSGKQVVGKLVRQCVERHVRDLERAKNEPDYPYYFHEGTALHRLAFNRFCLHSKGKWAG
ncbi:MAG: terminase large subunit, partial [Dehalococcoidia bacterium]|nr:terminase large subunit [Dehalococcoidia bacterium]